MQICPNKAKEMTLPYLTGFVSNFLHPLVPHSEVGPTAVPALHKEVGQALGPQRLRPRRSGLHQIPPACLASVRPCFLLPWRPLAVFGIWRLQQRKRPPRILLQAG